MSRGVAVGLYDRVELSAARWTFGLADTVPDKSIDEGVWRQDQGAW